MTRQMVNCEAWSILISKAPNTHGVIVCQESDLGLPFRLCNHYTAHGHPMTPTYPFSLPEDG